MTPEAQHTCKAASINCFVYYWKLLPLLHNEDLVKAFEKLKKKRACEIHLANEIIRHASFLFHEPARS